MAPFPTPFSLDLSNGTLEGKRHALTWKPAHGVPALEVIGAESLYSDTTTFGPPKRIRVRNRTTHLVLLEKTQMLGEVK